MKKAVLFILSMLFLSIKIYCQNKTENSISSILSSEKEKRKILIVYNDSLFDFIKENDIPDFPMERLSNSKDFEKINIIKLPISQKGICDQYWFIIQLKTKKK